MSDSATKILDDYIFMIPKGLPVRKIIVAKKVYKKLCKELKRKAKTYKGFKLKII